MPTKAPESHRFHVILKDPDSEQRRLVTISWVPCPTCKNDPIARGGYTIFATTEGAPDHRIPTCRGCDGSGHVPATAESAAAHLEAEEEDNVKFRLDEPATLGRYAMSMPHNALEIVSETVLHVPKDTHTVNGFFRAGKVVRNGGADPSVPYSNRHKGWLQFHLQEKPYEVVRVGRDAEKMVLGGLYGVPIKNLMTGVTNGVWDWDTDTIKAALTTSTYTVDIDTHDFFNDVTNELSTAGNYTAGGWTITSAAGSYDTGTDQARLDCADITQASASFTARKMVFYKSTGTGSTSPLISYLDFQSDVSPSAGTFTVTIDTTGVVVIDVT